MEGSSGMAMCLLTDAEGTPLGSPMFIPHNAGPLQLTNLVNTFLNNEENLPYSFYVSDEELLVSVGTYMERNSVSVENVLKIVYRQQAVFRIRPVNRCSQTIHGHAGEILCVSFSPDGKQLASGSGDTTVRLWDLNTETPMFTCIGHRNHVLAVAWSPDAKCLVSGDKDGKVCCWDPSKGELQGKPLEGHKQWICGIAWEPAHLSYPSRRFVTCGEDGDARIWDFTLKRTLVVLSGHTQAVTCVKWGGDGTIYTGSQDSTIKMWEITQQGQGILKHTLTGHARWVNSLALSTEYVLRTGAFDHTRQIRGSDEEMKQLWDGVTGEFITAFRGHVKSIYQMSWSADSRMLLSCSADSTVKVWDIRTKRLKHDLPGHAAEVWAVDWSLDGEKVASGGVDKVLKLWKG